MSAFAVEYVYAPEAAELRDQHRPDHRSWLASQVDAGVVLASGPYADGSGALIIFSAADEEELKSVLAQDPFARQGCIAGSRISAWNP